MAEWGQLSGDLAGYEVSSVGELRRCGSDRLLRLPENRRYLGTKVGTRNVMVHTLVAQAFLGPRPVGMEVRHLNGNAHDNRVENLRYGTPTENARDRLTHGTHFHANKTHCAKGHAYDEANTYRYVTTQQHQARGCRACNRIAVAQYKARKRAAVTP